MKKSLMAAALAVTLATGASAAQTTTYYLTSNLVNSGNNNTTFSCNVFDYVKGHNKNYINDEANLKNYLGVETLPTSDVIAGSGETTAGNLNGKQYTLSSLYGGSDLPSTVVLDSLSFISHHNTSPTQGIYLQVKQGNDVLGTSSTVVYDGDASTDGIYGVGTFTFDSVITLDTDTAYTFTFVDANGAVHDAARGEFNPYYSNNGGYDIDGAHHHQPVISITVHAIPEPATATLSLLALAGLAARRRRK